MTVNITGNSEKTGKVTCKISSDFLESFMGMPPTQMRIMAKKNKEEKEEVNKIVSQGGSQVLIELQTLSSCHMKLLHSTRELFPSLKNLLTSPFKENLPEVDGNLAIMLLFKKTK